MPATSLTDSPLALDAFYQPHAHAASLGVLWYGTPRHA